MSAAEKTPEILVRRGQIWCTRPEHKGARMRFVRIVGVARSRIPPRVTWREVTRTGRPKGRKTGPTSKTFLTFVDGCWRMPSRWKIAEEKS